MYDIFDNSKDILEQISFCLPIIILAHDPYPQKVCHSCFHGLEATVRFIKKCVTTDKSFKHSDEVYTRTININRLPLDGPTECEICKIHFTDMNLFDKHIEEHKSELESFICQEDENYHSQSKNHNIKLFSSKSKLVKDNSSCLQKTINGLNSKKEISETDTKRHEKKSDATFDSEQVHKQSKKIYTCTFCLENFQSHKELKVHYSQNHNSTGIAGGWFCKFCNKSMTTKVGLLIHERIHYGTKPYICEWCGHGFRSRANLTQHQVIHTGVRKYACPRCNKKFSRRSFVATHMRVHTGERPFCCDICGYRFTQIGDMRRHRNKHQTYSSYTSNVKTDQLAIE
ncbi:uncharacterized protein isoform X2 [Rhodnius prolixus]